MKKEYYRKVIAQEIDRPYIRFVAEDMLGDCYPNFETLKNFFILDAIAHESDFPSEGKQEIASVVNACGNAIREKIIKIFQDWLRMHTSAENLLQLDDPEVEQEHTVGWLFVESGSYAWQDPMGYVKLVDIRQCAYNKVRNLPYPSEDLRFIRSMIGAGDWKEIDEDIRIRLVKMCGNYIFKEWRKIFGEYLKKPTKEVAKAVERMQNASIRELPGAISLALSVQHVFGGMFEKLDMSKDELDYLHSLPQSEIDLIKNKLLDIK